MYECEDCSGCLLRDLCTKAKEGNNRRVYKLMKSGVPKRIYTNEVFRRENW
ncbi:hypothetical protein SPD53_15225 [Oceanobacillus sp. MO10714A]